MKQSATMERKKQLGWYHPESLDPPPRPVTLLWEAVKQIGFPYLKDVYVGGEPLSYGRLMKPYYVPVVINYKPGVQYKLAVDFLGGTHKWLNNNRIRSGMCARDRMEYLAIRRDLTIPEMIVQVKTRLMELRKEE